jgi:hypothetical protein
VTIAWAFALTSDTEMCGIIGIIGGDAAAPHLIDALKR